MSEMNPFLQYEAKPTRQRAIKAMCAACMGCTKEELEVGFRQMIKDCTSVRCPLHRFRPFQSKESSDAVTDTTD
jgi:hypothetical protein